MFVDVAIYDVSAVIDVAPEEINVKQNQDAIEDLTQEVDEPAGLLGQVVAVVVLLAVYPAGKYQEHIPPQFSVNFCRDYVVDVGGRPVYNEDPDVGEHHEDIT